jgi:hypothetical protein
MMEWQPIETAPKDDVMHVRGLVVRSNRYGNSCGAHSISYPLSKKAKASAAKAAMAVCDECGKRVKATGLWQHKRDAHKAA